MTGLGFFLIGLGAFGFYHAGELSVQYGEMAAPPLVVRTKMVVSLGGGALALLFGSLMMAGLRP